MIIHSVNFWWQDGVSPDDVEDLRVALNEMASNIPELRSYTAGPNLHLRPGGADFGVIAMVDDEDALHAYLDNPLHLDLYAERIAPFLASRHGVQLPIADGSLRSYM